jgi:hypothetical protein
VRNPFTLAKYAISNYDKTWYTKLNKNKSRNVNPQALLFRAVKPSNKEELSDDEYNIEGPFSSYEMDKKFKNNELELSDLVGISAQEFFDFKYLIEIVYPLPKLRNYDGTSIISKKHETQSTIGGGAFNDRGISHLFKSAKKFNRIYDESDKASVGFSEQATPFKRTPFKHVLGSNPKLKLNKDGFMEIDDDLIQSAKKSKNMTNVNETFVVKSWKKAFPRVPKSSQEQNKTKKVFQSLTDVKARSNIERKMDFEGINVVKRMTFIMEEKVEDEEKSNKQPSNQNDNGDSDEGSLNFELKEDKNKKKEEEIESDEDSFDFELKEED